MAAKGVNLDALIPREDFAVETGPVAGTSDNTISIAHLSQDSFWASGLRKPDFQRETVNWTPQKVVELVAAFLDGDLIPAIILWRAGQYVFVIDGAHRLSALLAWIYDDYGDRSRSLNFFGNFITAEQKELAQKTWELIESQVGSYARYADAKRDMFGAPDELRARLSGLVANSLVAQWVPAVDAEGAQNSFFKINQKATPLDPIERRILKARNSATAISSRAITRGGTGHKYWKAFPRRTGEGIERLGREINDALYLPPMGPMPLKSSDVPVAGKGYNALPFIFDLVNLSNSVEVHDSTTGKDIKDNLPDDPNGEETLKYLKAVHRRVRRITTTHPSSLGLHPLVYFYTRSGAFQPAAFLAVSNFMEDLAAKGKLNEFIEVRKDFERFLLDNKEVYSLTVSKLGSGQRSRPALERFLQFVLAGIREGKSAEVIKKELGTDSVFAFLDTPKPKRGAGNSGSFSTSTKTAAFIAELATNGLRCGICEALLHKNSIQTDHIVDKKHGGGAHLENAQISHPYCNSTFKQRGN